MSGDPRHEGTGEAIPVQVKRACKCMTSFDYSIAGIFCGAVIFAFFIVKWDL